MRRRAFLLVVWLLGVVGLWNLLPHSPRVIWQPPSDGWVVGVSPDGLAVTAHGNRPFLAHQSPFGTPDEGEARGPVEAWDVASGQRLWAYGGPDDRLHVGYGPSAVTVFVRRLGPPSTIVRLDPQSGVEQPMASPQFFDGQPANWYAHDGTVALVDRTQLDGSGPCTLSAYSTATGQRLYTLPPRFTSADAVSADGQMLAELESFDVDPPRPWELVVRESATGRECCRWPRTSGEMELWPAAVSPNGSRVLTGHGRLFDTVAGRMVPFQGLDREGRLEAMLTRDGRWVVIVDDLTSSGDESEHRLDWYDSASGRLDVTRRQILGKGEGWSVLAYAPDMRNYAYGKAGKWLCLDVRHTPSPSAAYQWLNRQAPTLFAVAGDDGYSRVVETDTGRVLADLPSGQIVRGVSDDGRSIMTEFDVFTNRQPGVAIWNTPPRPSLRLFAALGGGWAVAFLVVGRRLGRNNRPRS